MHSTSVVSSTARLAAALAFAWACAPASAQPQVFSDRAAFLTASQAQAEPALPNLGRLPGDAAASFTIGHLTLTVSAPSSGLWIGSGNHPLVGPDWTTLVAGNDIAIDGRENLNIDFDAPMTAFGFDFAEPTTATVLYPPCSQLCPCANSVYHVVLRLNGAEVAAFDFNRPDDTAAFVGVLTDTAFDRAEVHETSGTCDDEYFGQMFTRPFTPPCDPDVNCDGAVNGFDVEATEQAVNGDFSNFCQASADLNGDGAENGFDIETEEQRVNGAPC
ncbi:hypothetical protein PHYC_00254 [Phycisphaerales bacterium]|nr:hypothetical protein PHYC_00254 [Phycisphaerales bacterium]